MAIDKSKLAGLNNLRPIDSAERANELREKGLEVRRKNKAEREAMKETLELFKSMKLDEVPQGVDVLRIAMTKAIMQEDMDEATRLAALVAPYETPKLAAQEITQNVTHSDATDEELARLAEELGVSLDDVHDEDIH